MRSPKLVVGARTFAAATTLAVALVALLIVVGRVGLPEIRTSPALPTHRTFKGSPDAPITIVEYSDFLCHFCQLFATTTGKELERAYIETGKVRLEYRHFPIFGAESVWAALASECAADQGRFWPYHDRLMAAATGSQPGDLTVDKLKGLARETGLDMEAFTACLDSRKYMEKVIRDYEAGKEAGVRATPTFFINGQRVAGAQPYEAFQSLIEVLLGKPGQ
ncbi:MAG: DsbA family protein [Chloroflexota bacterium]|nr:DsbA family protein [Chloroflexota bacterium]